MRRSRITFDIETAKVRTIVELLIDQVSNFSVGEIPDEPGFVAVAKGKSTEWMKPIAVEISHAMRANASKEWHYTEFAPMLKKQGRSPNIASAVLSEMERIGRVKRVKRGVYQLITV